MKSPGVGDRPAGARRPAPVLLTPAIQAWFLIQRDFFCFFVFFNSPSESPRMDPSSTRPWFLIHWYFHDFPSSSRPWFMIFDFFCSLIFLIQRKIRYERIRPSSQPWFMIFFHTRPRLHIDVPEFTWFPTISHRRAGRHSWFFDVLTFLIFLIQHQFLSARASAGGPRAPADPSSIRPWFLIQRVHLFFLIFFNSTFFCRAPSPGPAGASSGRDFQFVWLFFLFFWYLIQDFPEHDFQCDFD